MILWIGAPCSQRFQRYVNINFAFESEINMMFSSIKLVLQNLQDQILVHIWFSIWGIHVWHQKHTKISIFSFLAIFMLKNMIFVWDFFFMWPNVFDFFFFWSCFIHIRALIKAKIVLWVFLEITEFWLRKMVIVYK